MGETNISNIMDTAMEKLRTVVDSDTIIGKPLEVNGITIIPVSRVSFGMASGGSDFPSKTTNAKMFGGGGGTGATVSPVCFLVVKGNEVKVLNANAAPSSAEKAISAVPEVVDKIASLFKKDKDKDDNTDISEI